MARARNIKPGFFQNEELGELEPIDRLFFIGLWTIADYKGCIEFRAKRIKVQLLPYDMCCIDELANNLERSGFISIYSVLGQRYIKILNFIKHQNPHKNERDAGSVIPDIDKDDKSFVEKRSKYRDLEIIENNHEEIGKNPEQDGTARAESLLLIPDSGLLIPDSSQQVAQQDKPAKNKKIALDYSCWPEMPSQQILSDWHQLRISKRAKVSQTVLDSFGKELKKAATFGYSVDDCLTQAITGGWTGFKFEWMQNQMNRSVNNNSTVIRPIDSSSTRNRSIREDLNDRGWAE